ncbi:MAG TPA: hypothetical protein VKT72_06685 [Candidatus Baltobacteraceae bacterium]|nr:hypothetical protein [Candidatus Baltobacteraceae bacterium]
MKLLAVVAAAAMATPSPQPSSQLKTIVNTRSTPFFTSIAQHFNAAVGPMLANDATLDQIDPQLVDLNDVFHHPDYAIRYSTIRVKLMGQVAELQKSLPFMQQQINQLRQGETLTKDPQDAKAIHQIAEKLQLAYNKQMQLETDLTGVVRSMMDYQPPDNLDIAQEELAEQQMPQDLRDIKSYLRFDGQRDVINQSENAAADSAITLVQHTCAINK